MEVALCGHATLAAAYVLFECEGYRGREVCFQSKSGGLTVRKDGKELTMNFPADDAVKVKITGELLSCFNIRPLEAYKGRSDYMLVFESEKQVKDIRFDLQKIAGIDARGIIITAKGKRCDFVSRFFAPRFGVNEDPVTGSAHTTLVPYWGKRLGKSTLTAVQLSARKGFLTCRNLGRRVEISGKAVLYMTGTIAI